jgi:rhomboid protease GluP
MQHSFKNSVYVFFKLHPVTFTILLINLMMIIVLMLFGGFDRLNLIAFGAIYPPYVIEDNQWHRLITAIFLHGGIVHFLGNSLVLFYLGSHLERLVGSVRYTVLYFFSGLVSSLFVVYLGNYGATTIGASGSIFGIVGALLLLTFLKPKWFSPQAIRSIRQLVLINLVLTFAIPFISIPGHIGGLIAGIILFYFMIPDEPYFQKKMESLRKQLYDSHMHENKEDDDHLS